MSDSVRKEAVRRWSSNLLVAGGVTVPGEGREAAHIKVGGGHVDGSAVGGVHCHERVQVRTGGAVPQHGAVPVQVYAGYL